MREAQLDPTFLGLAPSSFLAQRGPLILNPHPGLISSCCPPQASAQAKFSPGLSFPHIQGDGSEGQSWLYTWVPQV